MILILIFAEALALYGLIGEANMLFMQLFCMHCLCSKRESEDNVLCSWHYSGLQGWQVSLVAAQEGLRSNVSNSRTILRGILRSFVCCDAHATVPLCMPHDLSVQNWILQVSCACNGQSRHSHILEDRLHDLNAVHRSRSSTLKLYPHHPPL